MMSFHEKIILITIWHAIWYRSNNLLFLNLQLHRTLSTDSWIISSGKTQGQMKQEVIGLHS